MTQRIGYIVYVGYRNSREDSEGEHSEKADEIDQRGAGKRTEPIGHLGVVEAVVDRNDDGRDCQRSDNAGVERLDTVNDGDAGGRGQGRGIHKAQVIAADLDDFTQKEAVGKIGRERLEAAARRLLLGKTDGQGYGKQERKALKDRPRSALDDTPKKVPGGSVYGEVTDNVYSRGEGGDADHEA